MSLLESDEKDLTCSSHETLSGRPASAVANQADVGPVPEKHCEPNQDRAAPIPEALYSTDFSLLAARIADTPDPCAALDLLQQSIGALGVDQGFVISFVRDSVDTSACRFMLACDPLWCQHYLERDFLEHDPWLLYAARHSEPILASRLAPGSPNEQAVVQLARDYGFVSTALFPAHSGAGLSRISLLVLGSSQAGYFEGRGFSRVRIAARVLAAEFHDWWLQRIRREFLLRSKFTSEDLDLLRRQLMGHTSKKMANDLGVSHQSINSRYQRMNQRLGVLNRRGALTLARECGLLG